MQWISRVEALSYFGLSGQDADAELEALVVEFELEAEIVNDQIVAVEADSDKLQEALFTRHEREVGHRPGDPDEAARVAMEAEQAEQAERRRRLKARKALERRVARREKKGR